MSQQCRAPGCGARTTRFGSFCTTHKSRLRRHGAPDQRAITKGTLKPYVEAVRDRIARNPESPVWPECEAAWEAVVAQAEGVLSAAQAGRPCYRPERLAAEAVIKLRQKVTGREVVETVLAMYLLQYAQPRRFRTDDAFRVQLVRRVRGLSEVFAGIWFDEAAGRNKRAYHELPPKAAQMMAGWLCAALGRVGVHLAKLAEAEFQAELRRTTDMTRALEELA